MFISFEGQLYSKQESLIFLLFGSWSLVKSSHPEVFLKKVLLEISQYLFDRTPLAVASA